MSDNKKGLKKSINKYTLLYENDYLQVLGVETILFQKYDEGIYMKYSFLSFDDKKYYGLNVDQDYQLLERKFKIKFIDRKDNSYDIEEFSNFSLETINKEKCYLYLEGNRYTNLVVIDQVEVRNPNGYPVFNAIGLSNKELEEIKQEAHFKTNAYMNLTSKHQYPVGHESTELKENFNNLYNQYYKEFYDIVFEEYITLNKENLNQPSTVSNFQKRLKNRD